MVICNKQKTPYDSYAFLKIYAELDDLFAAIVAEMGMKEEFEKKYKFKVECKHEEKYDAFVADEKKRASHPSVFPKKNNNKEIQKAKPIIIPGAGRSKEVLVCPFYNCI